MQYMSENTEVSTQFDTVKLILSVIILLSGIVAFYYYSEQLLLFRVLGLLVAAGVTVGLILLTEKGRSIKQFAQGSVTEVKKVVWPTRKETMQTTLIVMVMVLLVGVLLWLFDTLLTWGITSLTGQGG